MAGKLEKRDKVRKGGSTCRTGRREGKGNSVTAFHEEYFNPVLGKRKKKRQRVEKRQ